MHGELRAGWESDLRSALTGLYGERGDEVADRLIAEATSAAIARPERLRGRDLARLAGPGWHQSNRRVGYMAYLDRFAGDLPGLTHRIDYLRELGVDLVHLLSVLEPRHGEHDGGYAIRDHLRPDPALGTTSDLDAAIVALHEHDMSLCLDFVLNHTADDHEWAVAARAGSAYHQRLYRLFPDRTEPDRWDEHLPEVFPNLAPGNFTWCDELERWVWTTFREFQWDLDYSNPDVLVEIARIALALANRGVDVLRLDAIAFTWKRMGTNCQNQPEAHLIAQALRATVAMAAPATILLAEAIVGPRDLVGYLGRHELERRECDLAYHNQLMVQGWSMLATGRADLATRALQQLPDPPGRATWFTYVRCHDDIGWAIDDADAAAVGLNGQAHREFLAAFFRGDFPTSFARGLPFGTNVEVGDERTSGMATALAGVADALARRDDVALDWAIRRILLLYAIAFGYGGIPVVYMGDELGQPDADDWRDDPERAADTRWAHRPRFDDVLAAQRHDPGTLAARMWTGMRDLVEARRSCRQLDDTDATCRPFDTGHPAVFGWRRHSPRHGDLIGLANVGHTPAHVAPPVGVPGGATDILDAGTDRLWQLQPLAVRWIAVPGDLPPVPAGQPSAGRGWRPAAR